MSTRSGRRIHNQSNEDTEHTEIEPVSKIERKTRSKRVVESIDNQGVVIKTKKRRNYVSYPADEDVTVSNNIEDENPVRPGRVLRTLKEQNAVSEEVEPPTAKKQVRQTRRTKKFTETAIDEPPETIHHEEAIEVVTITNGKSKSKKNKKKSKKVTEQAVFDKENEVKEIKKKNKRQKHLQSNASVEHGEVSKGNVSTDSFHSATGSPVHVDINRIMSPKDKSSPTNVTKVKNPAVNDSVPGSKNKRRSSLKNKSFDSYSPEAELIATTMDVDAPTNTTFDKEPKVAVEDRKRRKCSLKNTSFEGDLKPQVSGKLNTTFEKEPTIDMPANKNKRKSNLMDITIEKIDIPMSIDTDVVNLDIQKKPNGILNVTFEKDDIIEDSDTRKLRKSSIKGPITDMPPLNTSQSSNGVIGKVKKSSPRKSLILPKDSSLLNGTFDIPPEPETTKQKALNTTKSSIKGPINDMPPLNTSQSSIEKAKKSSPRKSLVLHKDSSLLNGTFNIPPEPETTKQEALNTTFDKQPKLNSTFDKSDSKSSLISSDASELSNITLDKSDELSKISITDDDSKTENILNQTPVIVESSMEASMLESSLKENKTPESKLEIAPLKREGTFTKEEPEVPLSPKTTPTKRQTIPTAGCTPYHSNGKRSEKKSVLNLTHSIEKPVVRSSLSEVPRTTRVMFCSPTNNPVVVMQRKSKIIKSNLKGSNKSFVYEEEPVRLGRKRSFTQCEEPEARAKRSRLVLPDARAPRPPPPPPPPRARAASAMAKMVTAVTPQKPTTPKPKSETKTRLPNFAALHARSFERMESLDECQQRRARRARHLLEPTGSLAVLERSSPRVTQETKSKETPPKQTPPKQTPPAKPAFKMPTLDTLHKGYTRFGFRMNCDVNPFSVPSKIDKKPKEIKAKVASLRREVTQPSLAGATSLRRAAAKQAILREKSFTQAGKIDEKRKECRTVIKGVRTNRRFELQMQSRNING